MTPTQRLAEIKAAIEAVRGRAFDKVTVRRSSLDWLIARVEELEALRLACIRPEVAGTLNTMSRGIGE